MLGVEAMTLVVGHHPERAPRLGFAQYRYNQFFDDLRGNVFQAREVALGKRE